MKIGSELKKDKLNVKNMNLQLKLKSFDLFVVSEALLGYDPDIPQSDNIIRKFILKKNGRDLENRSYELACDFYESIIDNTYFSNDYYIYKRLTGIYSSKKDNIMLLNIVKRFFESNIYCDEYDILFFKDKLEFLNSKNYISNDEMAELLDYYNRNGAKNQYNQNFPIVIAERIYQIKKGFVGIYSLQSVYKRKIKFWLKRIVKKLEENNLYLDAIDFYWELIENSYNEFNNYKKLIELTDTLKDYSNELYVIAYLYQNEPKIVKKQNSFLESKINHINLNFNSNYSKEQLKIIKLHKREAFYENSQIILKMSKLYMKGLLTSSEFDNNVNKIFFQPKDIIYNENKIKTDFIIEFQNNSYKNKVSFVKDFIEYNLSKSISDLIKDNKWYEDTKLCVDIINNTVTIDEERYIFSVLDQAIHRRDKRSNLEYACDLILGWLLEDCIVEMFEEVGVLAFLNSADKSRKILEKPTADSDLKILYGGNEYFIEIVSDFTGYWKKTQRLELRDNKYINLKNENSILLGLDFKNFKFLLINVKNTKANYISYHKPFRKPAYSINLTENSFHNLDIAKNIIINYLNEIS